jgi:hypothetical protein
MDRKVLLAQLALAAVAAAGAAQAQTVPVNDGGAGSNGDLFLIVEDTTAQTAYVQDMGITTASIVSGSNMNSAVAGASAGTLNHSLSFSYSEALDGALQTQLSTHSTDSYTWEVIAGSTAATNAYLATSAATLVPNTYNSTFYSNGITRNNQGQLVNDIDNWTLLATTFAFEPAGYVPASASFIGFTNQSGQPGTPSNTGVETWYGNGSIVPTLTLNKGASSSTGFYLVSADDNGASPAGAADIFQLGTVTLNAATNQLVFAPSAVPLPAAVWLLGSGLVGLAGVARRRRLAAA